MSNDTPNLRQKFCRKEDMSTSLGDVFQSHVEERYSPLKHAHISLAERAGVTFDTAKNWLRKRCCAQADNLGELIKNDRDFRLKVKAWIESLE